MSRRKLTLRAALVLQLIIAVALWLTLSAVEVYRATESHEHTWVGTDSGRWGLQMDFVERDSGLDIGGAYSGMPWRGGQVPCLPTPGRIEEVCSLTHPEIVIKSRDSYKWTSIQFDLYHRLRPR